MALPIPHKHGAGSAAFRHIQEPVRAAGLAKSAQVSAVPFFGQEPARAARGVCAGRVGVGLGLRVGCVVGGSPYRSCAKTLPQLR